MGAVDLPLIVRVYCISSCNLLHFKSSIWVDTKNNFFNKNAQMHCGPAPLDPIVLTSSRSFICSRSIVYPLHAGFLHSEDRYIHLILWSTPNLCSKRISVFCYLSFDWGLDKHVTTQENQILCSRKKNTPYHQ